ALMTSPDFRRIFSASSLTVTDSGTRISSRLTSAGGAVVSTAAAAAAAGADGAAGRPGAATAAAGWAGRAGAGRSGAAATRGGANSVAGRRAGRTGACGGVDRSTGRHRPFFRTRFLLGAPRAAPPPVAVFAWT